MRLAKCLAINAVFGCLVLSACDRQTDIREMHPVLLPFYAANCYGKSLEEKVRNNCNLTKDERAALDQARDAASRQQTAIATQKLAQSDAQFSVQKANVVANTNRWLDTVLQRLNADPRTRLERSGPSMAFDLAQYVIREEHEKCFARTSLGERSGGAPCGDVMRWQLEASTRWLQNNLMR